MRWIVVTLLGIVAVVAHAAPFAYVPNEGSGTVSVVDTGTDRVTSTITTGGKPRGIAISPDGKKLYVSEQVANGLAIIDVGSGKEPLRVKLGESLEGIYLSADGRWLAAAIEVTYGMLPRNA